VEITFGQLGVGDTAEYLTPHLISTLEGKGIKNFVCGSVHSIALLGKSQIPDPP
jgi:alpha-tubulin suppressor-like RCC1 family protein